MKIREGFKVRNIAGENVVIMHGSYGVDMTKVIALNNTSLLLWNRLQEREFEIEDVAQILVEEYGIDSTTALSDASAWVEKLEKCKLI